MDPQTELAFEFAKELATQLITLSTAIIMASVAIAEYMSPKKKRGWALPFAWTTYLISIVFGVWTLMALTGSLSSVAQDPAASGLGIGLNVKLPAALQVLTFLVGTIAIVVYAFKLELERSR